MLKKTIFAFFVIITGAIILSINNKAHTNVGGAPAGNTGSPADNKTCARSGCHPGSATTLANLITSNVPVTGYIPGATYSFTASISQSSITRFGFQVSPQSATGVYQGTLIVTNSNATQITGTKYITHKSAGTSGTGSKTWTFDWRAPAAGTGSVTFYGAFNAADNSSSASGDQIYKSTLTVAEDLTASVNELTISSTINIYPNPSPDKINVTADIKESGVTSVSILNMEGRLVKTIFNEFSSKGKLSCSYDINGTLPAGTYFIMLENNNISTLQKFIVIE